MTTSINRNDRELVVKVEGQLDAVTSEEFIRKIEQELEGIDTINIDCSDLTYISSAGLRALVTLSNDLGDGDDVIRLSKVGEQVSQVLKLTGMNELFTILD